MSVLGALTIKIVGDLSQFNKDISSVQRQLNTQTKGLSTVAKSMTTIGDTLTKSISLPLIAVGAASVKAAMDFETSMRNVNSISNLSEAELAKLSKQVIDISKTLPQSAKTLAEGLYDISSSGFAGAEGLEVLEASAKAASAGMTSTEVAAKGIVSVLNAYGFSAKDAGKISDTMFRTVDKGIITFEELSTNIGDVISTAHIAGINFNELSGMLGYMTTKGINAAEATTALNRFILAIIKPTDELKEVLKGAGYESGEAAIKALGLAGVLELMQEKTGGSLDALMKLTPEMRELKASASLLGSGMDELNNYMKDFNDTSGATDIALQEQAKSLSFQFDLLKNNATAVGIEIGNIIIPKLKDAIGAIIPVIQNIADKFSRLSPAMQDSILKWGFFVAAIGPALSVTGRMITSVIQPEMECLHLMQQ